MIKTKTVFVVGAGGSVPYGFPTGMGLRNAILNGESGSEDGSLMDAAVRSVGGREAYRDLARALHETYPRSVDALLEHRPALLQVGKAAIAAALLPLESSPRLFETKGDWIGYLISLMDAPEKDFQRNAVSFVTFNYDRVIEHRLTRAVAAQFGISARAAWEIVKLIPVVHVYGQLGAYTPLEEGEQGIPILPGSYDLARTPDRVDAATTAIQLIHERGSRSNELERARELISMAERVFFLGFGYDATNISRLKTTLNMALKDQPVVGTSFDMRTGETNRARALIQEHFPVLDRKSNSWDGSLHQIRHNQIVMGSPKSDALDTLREYSDLLV